MENLKVIVRIKDGVVFDVDAPEYVDVVVRIYDVDELEMGYLEKDEDGDYYIEQIW